MSPGFVTLNHVMSSKICGRLFMVNKFVFFTAVFYSNANLQWGGHVVACGRSRRFVHAYQKITK